MQAGEQGRQYIDISICDIEKGRQVPVSYWLLLCASHFDYNNVLI